MPLIAVGIVPSANGVSSVFCQIVLSAPVMKCRVPVLANATGSAVAVHAVDVASLRLEEGFTAADLESALAGHVLATARTSGVYSLNRNLVLS